MMAHHDHAAMVLTPSNDKADHGIRATDNAKGRKVPYVIVVFDCQ